jgi:hypothetical protein
MEWTTSFIPEQQIVVFQTHGVANGESSLEMVNSIVKTMSQNKVLRCLIDHSALSSVSGSAVDIYYRPQKLREMGVPPQVKIAEIVLPAHREHFVFLETVFRNRNMQFCIFNDRESAIQWLTE